MKDRIMDLWRGHIPLAQAFWTFTILFGTLINALATGVMFAAMAAGVPAAAAILFHLLPLPYNALALIAVWRSAKAYDGSGFWATAAQLVAAVWFAAMIVL
jgi:predicted anti-sigma-YlaC factor YlaD